MSEVRNTLPYISHLKVTERTTLTIVPSQVADQNGDPQYKFIEDYPGIQAEITTYMGNVKGPGVPIQFLYKAFYQEALDNLNKPLNELNALKAIEEPTVQQTKRIQQLEIETSVPEYVLSRSNLITMLNNSEVAWVEDLLTIAGIPSFIGMWQAAFSDAMDELSVWKEPETPVGGIPIYIAPMQWNARIPYESNKSVNLTIGMFLREDYSDIPIQHQINFEDNVTRANREREIAQYEDLVSNIDARLLELDANQDQLKTQLEQEKKRYQDNVDRLRAIEPGLIKNLIQNASIQESLPKIIMAIFAYLQMKTWPNLDLELVQSKLTQNLMELAQ